MPNSRLRRLRDSTVKSRHVGVAGVNWALGDPTCKTETRRKSATLLSRGRKCECVGCPGVKPK